MNIDAGHICMQNADMCKAVMLAIVVVGGVSQLLLVEAANPL